MRMLRFRFIWCLAWLVTLGFTCMSVAWGDIPASGKAPDRQYTLGILTQRAPGDPFWGGVEDIMEEACQQLGMRLRRYHAYSNQRNMVRAVDQAADDGVDVLGFPNFRESVPEMLERSRQRGLPVFLFNADVNKQNRKKVGKPRGKYPLWLGRLMSDDEQAGYILAKMLIDSALVKHLAAPGQTLKITGLTGTLVETPAFDRVDGLYRAVSEYKNVRVNQVVHAFWEENLAYSKTLRLLERYPDTHIVWSASDHMALGAVRALKEVGKLSEVVLGGVDWTESGVRAMQSGVFEETVGGQMADGAWVAAMLYDYLHGRDFADDAVDIRLPMKVFPRQQAHEERYLQRLANNDWRGVNFRQFSKVRNPELKRYVFDSSVLYMPDNSITVSAH